MFLYHHAISQAQKAHEAEIEKAKADYEVHEHHNRLGKIQHLERVRKMHSRQMRREHYAEADRHHEMKVAEVRGRLARRSLQNMTHPNAAAAYGSAGGSSEWISKSSNQGVPSASLFQKGGRRGVGHMLNGAQWRDRPMHSDVNEFMERGPAWAHHRRGRMDGPSRSSSQVDQYHALSASAYGSSLPSPARRNPGTTRKKQRMKATRAGPRADSCPPSMSRRDFYAMVGERSMEEAEYHRRKQDEMADMAAAKVKKERGPAADEPENQWLEMVRDLFRSADTSDDGELNAGEVTTCIFKLWRRMGFADGQSLEEFRAPLIDWVKQSIGVFDSDDDGYLNCAEFVNLMKNADWEQLRPSALKAKRREMNEEKRPVQREQETKLNEGGGDDEGVRLEASGWDMEDREQLDVEAAVMALGAMHKADDHFCNEEITSNECHTFLKGTDFHPLYEWLFSKAPGQRRDRFRQLDLNKGGTLDITDLHAAVRMFLGLRPVPRAELLQPGALSKARAGRQVLQGKKKITDKSVEFHHVASYSDKKKAKKKVTYSKTKVEDVYTAAVWDTKVGKWSVKPRPAPSMILDGVQLSSTKDRGVAEGPLFRANSALKEGSYTGDAFYGLQRGMGLARVVVDNSIDGHGGS